MSAAESTGSFNKRQQLLRAYTEKDTHRGCVGRAALSACTAGVDMHAMSAHNRYQGWSWLFAGLGLDSSVSQKWPKYYLMVQRFTPVTWNGICRIKCSPSVGTRRPPAPAQRDPAEHEVMTPQASNTELTAGCPDSSQHHFHFNPSFSVRVCVRCFVACPLPVHTIYAPLD